MCQNIGRIIGRIFIFFMSIDINVEEVALAKEKTQGCQNGFIRI